MPIDPRIALQVQSPQMQNPLEAFGQVMSLKNMLAQSQVSTQNAEMNQMKLTQMKRQFAAEEMARQILGKYQDADPTIAIQKAMPELIQTLGVDAIPIAENVAKWEKEKNALAGQKLTQYREGLNFITGNIEKIFNTPEEQRDQAYQMIRRGLPPEAQQALPPQWDDQLFGGYYDKSKKELQDVDLKLKQEQLEKTKTERFKTEAELMGTAPMTQYQQKSLEQQGKPNTAAELAVIASDPNKSPEDRKIANDALKILEKHAIASKPVTNVNAAVTPLPGDVQIDPNSTSILAQTGLSMPAFLALTGQAGSLPRDRATRAQAFAEAQRWSNKHGVDISTMGSQYKAYNEVLNKNIQRVNATRIMESELQATIENLRPVVKAGDLKSLRIGNVIKIWGGKEVNDNNARQYAMHLEQLRTELAAYNAAAQGRSGNEINVTDYQHADNVIQNGLETHSLDGLSTAIKNSTAKMGKVMDASVDRSRKAIWSLFGVGQNYKGTEPKQETAKTGNDPLGIR